MPRAKNTRTTTPCGRQTPVSAGSATACLIKRARSCIISESYFLDDPAGSAWIADAPAGAIVGVFGDGSAKKYVLVANKNYRRPLTGELRLRRRCRIERYAQDTDILCPVADGAASVALHIPAGDAALFILS